MFTIEQIKKAHSKVESGADFPSYIQELKTLGIMSYINFVNDGTTQYFGANDYSIASSPKYAGLEISPAGSEWSFPTPWQSIRREERITLLFVNRRQAAV
jgi:hypothetical protein